jgi:hypothetical protein
MRVRGFWDTFFDSDTRRREDIDQALDATDRLEFKIDTTFNALNTKMMRLAMTVDVLLDILEEHDLLDPHELDRRVRERLDPPQPAPAAGTGGPYREGPSAEPPPVRNVMCTRCQSTVPISATQITASGVVCDRCMASAP